jgi:hypothetical protein
MIRPKDDGIYMIELRTAAREALTISSDGEMEDPILRGIDRDDLIARNPCLRRGPLSLDHRTRLLGGLVL